MTDTLSRQIPLLNRDLFRTHYFKHTPEIVKHFPQHEYIELHNRCILKNSIPAHRLDFYMIFLITAGQGIHTLGSREHYVRKNMLCFIGPNIINSWMATDDENQGFIISFSDEFFNAGRADKQFLSALPFFQIDDNAIIYLSDEEVSDYASLFKMIEREYCTENHFSGDTLRGYLQVLISKARAAHVRSALEENQHNKAGVRLVKEFTSLYMSDVNTVRTGSEIRLKRVADYAEQLGVSQNHLNDTIRKITGQSAGQLMRNQLVKQATMCLKHSSKTISEIAYLLGFEDPSYFSRFYKKQTGMLPSDFR